MKWKALLLLLLLGLAGVPPGVLPSAAATLTTKYALSSTAWTDLGAGPLMISATGQAVYAISDTTPAIPLNEGLHVPTGGSIVVNTTSHVWAMNAGVAGAAVYAAPIVGSGGGGGGGITSIAAGTIPTTGFTAGQLLMSDGTVTQPAPITNIGTAISILPAGAGGNGVSYFSNTYIGMGYGTSFGWGAAGSSSAVPEVALTRRVAKVLSLYDQAVPTSAMAFRAYNTYTDDSNGEWGTFDWQTTPNTLSIGTTYNGTGSARNVQFVVSGLSKLVYSVGAGAWYLSDGMVPVNGFVGLGAHTAPYGSVYSWAFISEGTQPTITGAGGTCAASTKVGGMSVGTVVLSGVCASTNTIAFTGMNAMTNGYVCDAEDRTTRTAGPFIESATTTTGFTLTVGATSSVANDILQWKCMGF